MSTGNGEPRIWVLLGERTGDNAQALAIGHAVSEAMGGEVVVMPLACNGHYRTPNLLLGATLRSLRRETRERLKRPWPDLVVGVGRRSVPVARWIRAQSGGSAKLVQIGRPRAPLAWFDIVVTTPQYRLPPAANVLHLLLPPLPPPALGPGELTRWRDAFASLPRPWIGVLVGGTRAPYSFDAEAAQDLGQQANAAATRLGGSLLVTTSPRTGTAPSRALSEAISGPAHRNLWSASADPADNAHHAILALADRFIVTAESVSMLAEACETGKPVAICELPRRAFYPAWSGERGLGRWLARTGLASPPRDPQAVVRRLVDGGHAAILGAPEPDRFVPAPDERARVVAAVRRLLDGRAAPQTHKRGAA
ncbi:MAG TPA: ELM1/GtrOC1 family putative glycosyltransferase [Aestuariivirgaceae bacterium]|nr:ELM1/GtrOC1 family putative glycosyltransferase [Aestuariivirgaceae bacterium]